MKIISDDNVPNAAETIGRFGDLTVLPGRQITREAVKDADILIIRSITKANKDLLEGSRVKFVGTTTIGYDHVDVEYLNKQEIKFSSAPGSNSNSVSEYLTAALLLLAEKTGRKLEGSSIAIVGCGNVGSKVNRKMEALGMKCFLNDPPLFDKTNDPKYIPLDDAIRTADFVTVHVPLEKTGKHPTINMCDNKFFQKMKAGSVFINASRGKVVVEKALTDALDSKHISHTILDVWQNEPSIDPDMLARAFIGTPHIAGHSFDGMVNGSVVVYEALCKFLGEKPTATSAQLLPQSDVPFVDLSKDSGEDEAILRKAVFAVYDITRDDRGLRDACCNREKLAESFDKLRKNYWKRREFHYTTLALPNNRETLLRKAEGLGFKIKSKN